MPRRDIIRKIIEFRQDRGFVTFGELNGLLPSTTTTPEEIEALLAAPSDEGIHVIEGEGP